MARTVIDVPGVDIRLTLRPLTMVRGDPTIRVAPGIAERATWTPEGPGAIRVTWRQGDRIATVETFGDGAGWLLDRAARFVGATDNAADFDPTAPVVRDLWRRFHGDRVPRTDTAWHDLSWAVVQQRVHRRDAATQWKRFVHSLGQPAPGIGGLFTPPDPGRVARMTPWSLRPLGIDAGRATTLITVARQAPACQRLTEAPVAPARQRLQRVRGIGPWTAGVISAFTFGDPDAVIVGDSGIPSLIATALAGERHADDARMLELLEPYRPHRYRVLRLVMAKRARRTLAGD